jgi:adenylate cyclase
LGRTVSPEVREQLRQGFASGDVKLEGQEAFATVLMADIRGFTTLSEAENPTTIMSWLNEYFEELVPIITEHGGIISKFEGDSILAFFGILPQPLSAQESAYQACRTALAMLAAIGHLNERRAKRGEPPLIAGIGVNTGPVTAGALGSADRLHYTIIGDTVNTAARLESLARQFGASSSAVISQHVLFALQERRHEFELEPMGTHNIKGKVEQLIVYHLYSSKSTG